jgi:hypothetical protein
MRLPFLTLLALAAAAIGAGAAIAAPAGAGPDPAVRAQLRAGVIAVPVSNPRAVPIKGTLELRLGKETLGRAPLALAAKSKREVKVKLAPAARSALAAVAEPRLRAVLRFRGPDGRPHSAAATLAVERPAATPKPPSTPVPPPPPAVDPVLGPDGTYRGASGLAIVVREGKVVAFNGEITTYCAGSQRQKPVAFGMYANDPAPQVGADGSFAWEATSGYGFVKLKFEGKLSGDSASGYFMVEDRSPKTTGDGRLEFDYCFAGGDWSAAR